MRPADVAIFGGERNRQSTARTRANRKYWSRFRRTAAGTSSSLSWSVRRVIPSRRAVSEMLLRVSARIRWMCSHSARARVGEGVGAVCGQAHRLPGERADDLIGVDRLAEIVVRAGAQRRHPRGVAAVAGEADDARAPRDGGKRPDQRQPRQFPACPQVDVLARNRAGAPRPPPARRRDRRRWRPRSRALAAPSPTARKTPRRRRRAEWRRRTRSRRRRDKEPERLAVVPRPVPGGSIALPQALDDGARQEDLRPIPCPAGLVVKNGSPTRTRRSDEMPAPRSAISKISRRASASPSVATRSVTRRPGGRGLAGVVGRSAQRCRRRAAAGRGGRRGP